MLMKQDKLGKGEKQIVSATPKWLYSVTQAYLLKGKQYSTVQSK